MEELRTKVGELILPALHHPSLLVSLHKIRKTSSPNIFTQKCLNETF